MLCTSLHCQNQSVLKIILPMLCTSLHCQNSKCPEDRPPHALYLTPLSKPKCPEDRPPHALYRTPLSKPKGKVWYSKVPMGHNTLGKIISEMMKEAGFEGHYTNHSLHVTSATRLFDAEVDEQLIMTRTGHSSTDGVRAYKRTSDKLRQLTSDVFNSGKQNVTPAITEAKPEPAPEPKRPRHEEKENAMVPTFQITGGTNITININSNSS